MKSLPIYSIFQNMGNFLLIEPFYGGSHKAFSDGLIKHSSHNIELLTLPARFWKWRMRGAALYFIQQNIDFSQYDGIIASNMLSLSDFKALAGSDLPPLVLYFHENQILYPLKEGQSEDLHYGLTDFTSAISADSIVFNSQFHRSAFLDSLQPFLRRFPDYRPSDQKELLLEKSSVLYPGVELPLNYGSRKDREDFPVILWNHRWEHDKNPEEFFQILFDLENEGIDFRVIVLGEQFSDSPEIFNFARKKLGHRILHYGYAEDYSSYRDLLRRSDIIISTSHQENFGISVVEAIGSGNFPLLPDRLSYRELIPEKYQKLCIYKNSRDLKKKLIKLIENYSWKLTTEISKENLRFSWENLIKEYDSFLDGIKKRAVH